MKIIQVTDKFIKIVGGKKKNKTNHNVKYLQSLSKDNEEEI